VEDGLKLADQVIYSTDKFIHSGYFYSSSSSPLLLRGAPYTEWILCRSFTPKRAPQAIVSERLA